MYILKQLKTTFSSTMFSYLNEEWPKWPTWDKKWLAKKVNKLQTVVVDNLDDDLSSAEINELRSELSLSKEEIRKFQTITNREFLEIPKKDRLRYIMKPDINPKNVSENVSNWKIKTLTFSFDLDWDWKINKELYLKTTAWQVLPEEVESVSVWNEIFSRSWLAWEFFDKNNKRLLIHDNTTINIEKLRSAKEIEQINANNSKIIEEYNDSKNLDIVSEAVKRWIDPKFAILAFWKIIESFSEDKKIFEMENIFTQFDRERWHINSLSNSEELYLKIFSKYNPSNWKELATQYWISGDKIKAYEDWWMANLDLEASLIKNSDSLADWGWLKGDKLLENPEFKSRLEEVANNIWATNENLISVMAAESEIDPRNINHISNATWLIQFTPDTAIWLWTTVWKLRVMSWVEQLNYVEKYFLQNNNWHKLDSKLALYKATFYPASLWEDDSYVFWWEKVANQNYVIAKYSKRPDWLIDWYAFREYVENLRA